MTEEEVQALFDEFDEDKSGSIEFDEFLILISKKASQYLLYLLDNYNRYKEEKLLAFATPGCI
jgi:Ca2+-binding EF-hand superfamily protein